MKKVLTIDFYQRTKEDGPASVGRKEFGFRSPSEAMQIIQPYLDDKSYNVQITYEGQRSGPRPNRT